MRILFDTNVVLDVLLERSPHFRDAAHLFGHVERGRITGLLGATTVTTIFYLTARATGRPQARRHTETLLRLFDVAPVGRLVLEEAARGPFQDYEDGVLHEAARHAEAVGIVTRNADDFEAATVAIYTPKELREVLQAQE